MYEICSYTYKIGKFFLKQEDIRGKIIDMVERGFLINDDSKLLYEELTEHKFGEPAKEDEAKEEAHEDYPPEPYNKTGEASCNDTAVSKPERKVIRTTFARQKVFPNELYLWQRKIRRFKELWRGRYASYSPDGERVANRTGIGKSDTRTMARIRGDTE